MKRQQFIAGAVSGAFTAAAVRKGFAKNSPNDTINVAVVGIHSRGQAHYAGFQRQPNVIVKYVVDVDEGFFRTIVPELKQKYGGDPQCVVDLRDILNDPDLHVVSIATPDHWHALQTIWSCQAGKDVYCEKPVCHNIWEGRKMVEAARRYNRIVATGTQSRSDLVAQKAVQMLQDGIIGRLYAAKALCYKPRVSIGVKPEQEPPAGLHYDLWLGPAGLRPYNENKVHYNWHWLWDFGDTDMGNQGVHQMDVMRWGLNKREHPRIIHGDGGLFENSGKSDQETPNTQMTTYEYADDVRMQFEVRGWLTGGEHGITIGNFFYGSEGWAYINGSEFQTYLGRKDEPGPGFNWTQMDYAGAKEAAQQPFKPSPYVQGDSVQRHFDNFIECVRSRQAENLHASIEEGFMSSCICHLGNISYRLGRTVEFDSHSERFVNDADADALLKRKYRPPFVVPEDV